MKTQSKFIAALLISFIGCLFLSYPVAYNFNITPHQAFINLIELDVAINIIAGFVIVFTRKRVTFIMPGSLYDISKEIWVAYIIENLFKDNAFMERSFNEGDYVLNGAVVHVPQAGSVRRVVKNRTQLPAPVTRRSDVDITYVLDEYTTDPIAIINAEQVELSYDKIANVLGEDMNILRQVIADDILWKWAKDLAASSIIRTTGSAVGPVGGQTGNRKMFLKEDLKQARYLMNKQNISKAGRVAVLPSEFYDQLQSDTTLLARDAQFGGEVDIKNGVVMRLYGFELFERSDVLTYDNSGTPVIKLPEAVSASTDNLAALAYHPDVVARAMGTVDAYQDLQNPLYYGDIYSFLTRMGGRARRKNGEGIISIVQATA